MRLIRFFKNVAIGILVMAATAYAAYCISEIIVLWGCLANAQAHNLEVVVCHVERAAVPGIGILAGCLFVCFFALAYFIGKAISEGF